MEDIYGVRERVDRQLDEAARKYWDYRSAQALGMIKRPEDDPPDADEASEEELEELNEDLIEKEKKEEKE